jgi:hypothetical protein
LSGKLRFATNELAFRVNDRLEAPNNDETFAAVKPELEALAGRIFAGPFELERTGVSKGLFSVRLTSPTSAPIRTLLERAGGPPCADSTLNGT